MIDMKYKKKLTNNGKSKSKDIYFYAEILSKENFIKILIACIWIVIEVQEKINK